MSIARPFDILSDRLRLGRSSVRAAAWDGLQLLITNGLVAALGFVTPLTFVRFTTPDDYGRFSLIAASVAFLNAVTLPGLNISLRQAVARGRHGALTETAVIRMRWACLGVIGLLLLGLWTQRTGDPLTGTLLMTIAPLFPFIYGMDVAVPFFNGAERFAAMSVLLLIAAAVPSAVVFAVIVATRSASLATLAYFTTVALINLAAFLWVLRRCRTNRVSDPSALAYGRRLTLITSLGTVQSYGDKLVVGNILSLQALAQYSVGKLFQQAMTIAWGALHQLSAPKLSSRDAASARRLTRVTLPIIWGGFIAVGALVIYATPWIVHVVFGSRYADSATAGRVLTAGLLATIPGAQFEVMFTSTGDEKRLYAQRVSFATLQFFLTAGGAYWFGLTGAVWGTALAYASNSVAGFVLDRWR